MTAPASPEPEILARKTGRVGRITLNRPAALNALTLGMVEMMTKALRAWRGDPEVKAVIVDGAGERAFCAGGDIRLLAESGKAKDGRAEAFWRAEYQLNALIAEYPKPYLALIDGVTMGGGVGVSVHAPYRIAGDRTLFAMPETGIGFHPDVGGSYFLPRLPGRLGLWMGLTGARLKAADCLAATLATHFVPSERKAELIRTLERADLDDDAAGVEEILLAFEAHAGHALLAERMGDIDRLFAGASAAAILAALEADGSDWAREQAKILRTKSPTALALTQATIARGARQDLRACLAMELAVSVALLDGADFYEGVRAVLIDKDNAPKWSPARLEEVTPAAIDGFFAPEKARPIAFIG